MLFRDVGVPRIEDAFTNWDSRVGFAERARPELAIPVYVHEKTFPDTPPVALRHGPPRSLHFVSTRRARTANPAPEWWRAGRGQP
jgi:hypothetical protein